MAAKTANTNITLTINDVDIHFSVGLLDYNKYINAMLPNDKTGPAHNFCVGCVADESKEALIEILNLPGAAIQIAGQLVDEYAPDMNIIVKKPKNGQKN